MLTLAIGRGLGSQAILFENMVHSSVFIFDKVFSQVKLVVLASFAFCITDTAARVVCFEF